MTISYADVDFGSRTGGVAVGFVGNGAVGVGGGGDVGGGDVGGGDVGGCGGGEVGETGVAVGVNVEGREVGDGVFVAVAVDDGRLVEVEVCVAA